MFQIDRDLAKMIERELEKRIECDEARCLEPLQRAQGDTGALGETGLC